MGNADLQGKMMANILITDKTFIDLSPTVLSIRFQPFFPVISNSMQTTSQVIDHEIIQIWFSTRLKK